ncbi:hypothetical protein [Arthrobacter psychrolactophilus]
MSEVAGPNESSAELETWLASLEACSGADTALAFAKTGHGSISLTHAHPSGLAQLLAGRKTRLSTLIREPEHYIAAKNAASALRAKIFEMSSNRGIDVGYLGAGMARWSLRGGAFRNGYARRRGVRTCSAGRRRPDCPARTR